MSLNIQPQEIIGRPKEIGHLDGNPVFQISLKGGLYIIATPNKSGVKILGTGPHRVVAKHVAKKLNPHLVITELMKSEEIEIIYFDRLIPFYSDLTNPPNPILIPLIPVKFALCTCTRT